MYRTKPSFFRGPPGNPEGQKVQDHRRPAGVPAPAPPEEERPEDFRNRVVDGRRLEHAGKKVVPKAFDLHVFPAQDAEVEQHVEADGELHQAAGVFDMPAVEKHAEREAGANVGKIDR